MRQITEVDGVIFPPSQLIEHGTNVHNMMTRLAQFRQPKKLNET